MLDESKQYIYCHITFKICSFRNATLMPTNNSIIKTLFRELSSVQPRALLCLLPNEKGAMKW